MVIILCVLGLCLGSFVNAFVWRLRQQADGGRASKLSAKQLSIVNGRSMCTHCHHPLAASDLIPVVSYLWLRGRCRYCGRAIEDTPLPELVTPLLFVLSYAFWPQPLHGAGLWDFGFWLVFLVGFVALSVYDLRWYELPHKIVLPLIGLAASETVVRTIVFHQGFGALTGPLFGAALGGGLFWLIYAISPARPPDEDARAGSAETKAGPGRRLLGLLLGEKYSSWIGFGDITLGLLLGSLVGGAGKALMMIFLASLLGTLVALPMLVRRQLERRSHLPFGPFLMVAAVIVVLWGDRLLHWYLVVLMVY